MWVIKSDEDESQTVIYYDEEEIRRIDGLPKRISDGYLVDPDIRPHIFDVIKSSDSKKMEMLTSLVIFGVDVNFP